ncbi:hypothetical protein KCV07_g391, partial [Aureobasidium melanogenum]
MCTGNKPGMNVALGPEAFCHSRKASLSKTSELDREGANLSQYDVKLDGLVQQNLVLTTTQVICREHTTEVADVVKSISPTALTASSNSSLRPTIQSVSSASTRVAAHPQKGSRAPPETGRTSSFIQAFDLLFSRRLFLEFVLDTRNSLGSTAADEEEEEEGEVDASWVEGIGASARLGVVEAATLVVGSGGRTPRISSFVGASGLIRGIHLTNMLQQFYRPPVPNSSYLAKAYRIDAGT